MNRNKLKLIFLSIILGQLFVAQVALAQTATTSAYSGPEATIRQFLCAPTTNPGAQQTGNSITNTAAPAAGNANPAAGDLYTCINRLYRFAIIAASIGAVLYIIVAGYMYMSSEGNGEMVDKAKSYITSALTALAILFAGYILLRALNPDLIQFRNIQPPSVTPASTTAPSLNILPGQTGSATPPPAAGGTEDQLRAQFQTAGISINAAAPQTTVAGMQQATINEIISLKNNCGSGCNVTITGGTESGHADTGLCTHSNGYKVDLASDSVLTSFIQSHYSKIATRSDGAQQWQNNADGSIYALETTQGTGPHWDITASCSAR